MSAPGGWRLWLVSVRYRRRVRLLDRITIRSRLISWDERFLYLDQSMWIKQQCANHILVRLAITDRAVGGIVPPARMIERTTVVLCRHRCPSGCSGG